MLDYLKKQFSNKYKLSGLYFLLCCIAVFYNAMQQAFCVPVPWAAVVLLIAFLPVVFLPIIRQSNNNVLHATVMPLLAGALVICLYCIAFIGHVHVYALFATLIGIGFIAFIPHFFAFVILKAVFTANVFKPYRKYFWLSIVCSLLVAGVAVVKYKQAEREITQYMADPNYQLEGTYMQEHIVGMHFKYHMQICEWDGWRPPLHDPLFNFAFWICGGDAPLKIDLSERVALYRKIFPNKPVQMKCSCAKAYSNLYFNDTLFKVKP